MMSSIDQLDGSLPVGSSVARLSWLPCGIAAAALDGIAVLSAALATGMAYYAVAFGNAGNLSHHLRWGGIFALVYMIIAAARGSYRFRNYVQSKTRFDELLLSWNIAAGIVLALMFLLKSGSEYSRGATVSLYFAGLAALFVLRLGTTQVAEFVGRSSGFATRKVVLVGRRDDIDAHMQRYDLRQVGWRAVGMLELDHINDVASLVRDRTRQLKPDDVILVVPWSEVNLIETLTDALMETPVAIHIAPGPVLDRYEGMGTAGNAAGLILVRAAFQRTEVITKRVFDIIVASLALVMLSPVLLLTAIAIKLDSKGPVLFRQTRHGFNHETFRVFKFRSMTVLEDGAAFRQATKGDVRITRVGRWLRRANIDELPQFVNVLLGHMSVVGPRPHPVTLNDAFDGRIAYYSRRHIAKPGITGWAQVHGYRGETDTEQKMRLRVEYDLYYLKNWSLWLDMRIILMTVFSPKSYRNAG
ncbi:Undecaprenyl-phosphate glucose phosphotransferase [Rhodoligotrophos appendicifer]|uniref:exopolysaccharide biosynthesis polyprenyl glycosylphosphotransferase n=1 Tax=Rhodoligotrophos appendicifer TaxID=987056 RepID=UPI0014798346|nr:exopolysaccharide biosynthesis polyprenyl glycosylphosphotransferase [Rhodoligotrophos appendicifer]